MALFKDGVAYTPKMLAATHGLDNQQWDNIIRHQLPQMGLPIITLGRCSESKKPRIAAFGRELNRWDEEQRRKAAEKASKTDAKKTRQPKKTKSAVIPGLTPDGKLMNSRQLKEAGLWKGA